MTNHITNYQEGCRFLDDMQMHKIKLGLDAVRLTLADLGSPEKKCPAVHVAGTNGKGSVCSMLRCIMTEAGYRTGLYTSPHLSSVRERFRIDDSFISEEEFTLLMEKIRCSLNGKSITYFECATALAFSWFAEQKCDLVIIETGMGGRLDATNVLVPLLSVITTISLDHEQYLGDTIEAVAFEKSGIIKQGIPVISGVLDPNAQPIIEQSCSERGAPLTTRNRDFMMGSDNAAQWCWQNSNKSVCIPGLMEQRGGWQRDNISCAVAAAVSLRTQGYTVSDDDIRAGLKKNSWPGRMELLTVPYDGNEIRFLLDGAHNSAGVGYLIDSLEQGLDYQKLYLVWASMADKKYEEMLRKVVSGVDHVMLTRPDSERAAAPSALAKVLKGVISPGQIRCSESVEESLEDVRKLATVDDLVVVAGSLFLVGAFRKLLVGEVVG